MNRLSPRLLCQVYMLLVLLAATIMSPLPYSLLALILLVVTLFITIRPLSPRLNVAINVATIFLTPLVLASLLAHLTPLSPAAGAIASAILVLPVIHLLDDNLRQAAHQAPAFIKERTGRHTTYIYISLFISALVMILLSPVVANLALLFTGIALILYLLGMLIIIHLTIPRRPLTTPTMKKRIIAGTTGSLAVTITSQASVPMYGYLSPSDAWVRVTPEIFILNKGETRLNLNFTPPLSGQACPEFRISVVDPRGFIQINESLEPVELHVIPRAKYAEWLARRYLKQTETGVLATALAPPKVILKRGIEYRDSRAYEPGDPLKDIDWKHTLKLRQLIVKEFIEAGEQAAIIAVNLAVTDAEAADKLAFNLITVALTLARENIPAALAAYNHQSVILKTAITSPSEILRQALSLVREITLVKFADRHLEPTDIAKIRRNINQLKQAESEPARRLLGLLSFEYSAIEEAARNHPATLALFATTKNVPAPAIILLVSQLNHDAEALRVTTEKLSKRKFTTISVATTI